MIIKMNAAKKLKFVIHDHHASKHHYDLRLQKPGSEKMWSFAIPKHKMPHGNDKFLAVKVEDHPLLYAKFEGQIKDGYGKGKVKIYDDGEYRIIEKDSNKIEFQLMGNKVNGKFTLIKTGEDKWLLIKNKHEIEKEIKTNSSYGAHELEEDRRQEIKYIVLRKLESDIGIIINAIQEQYKTDFNHNIEEVDYIDKFINKYILENATEVFDCVRKGTVLMIEHNYHKLLDHIIKYIKMNWENRNKIFAQKFLKKYVIF